MNINAIDFVNRMVVAYRLLSYLYLFSHSAENKNGYSCVEGLIKKENINNGYPDLGETYWYREI